VYISNCLQFLQAKGGRNKDQGQLDKNEILTNLQHITNYVLMNDNVTVNAQLLPMLQMTNHIVEA